MIYVLCFLALTLTVWCRNKKRNLEKLGQTAKPSYLLAKNALAILVPFSAVAIFYALLSLYVPSLDQDSTSLAALYSFETGVRFVTPFIALLKPAAWVSVLVLTFLFGLGAWNLRSPARGQKKRRKGPDTSARWAAAGSKFFTRYSKAVGIVYGTLALVCSFSFFATAMEPRLKRLELRIARMEDDLVLLGAGLEQAFEAAVREEALRQVFDAAPPAVTTARNDFTEALRLRGEIRQVYETARLHLRLEKPSRVAEVLRREEAIRKTVESAVVTAEAEPAQPRIRKPLSMDPAEVTGEKIAEVRAKLASVQEGRAAWAATVLELEPRKKLTGTLLGVLLNPKHIEVFAAFLKEVPFAEPVVSVFQKTLSELAGQAVEKKIFEPGIERLRKVALEGDPGSLEKAMRAEAESLVREHGKVTSHWQSVMAEPAGRVELAQQAVSADLDQVRRAEAVMERAIRAQAEVLRSQRQAVLSRLRQSFQAYWQSLPKRAQADEIHRATRASLRQKYLQLPAQERRAWLRERQALRERYPKQFFQEDVRVYLEQVLERSEKAEVSASQVEKLERIEQRVGDTPASGPAEATLINIVHQQTGKELGLHEVRALYPLQAKELPIYDPARGIPRLVPRESVPTDVLLALALDPKTRYKPSYDPMERYRPQGSDPMERYGPKDYGRPYRPYTPPRPRVIPRR